MPLTIRFRMRTHNPLVLIDELDKMGADWRGDPASAMLEVLDPEQNNAFRDHYLDLAFDLSKVLFICTANALDTIPGPLLDRMDVIELAGYTEEEKLGIAKRYLVKKQILAHGLKRSPLRFSDLIVRTIIREYTREAGVRNSERRLADVCHARRRPRSRGTARQRSHSTTNGSANGSGRGGSRARCRSASRTRVSQPGSRTRRPAATCSSSRRPPTRGAGS
jgi:ATP-dependent Lon protease